MSEIIAVENRLAHHIESTNQKLDTLIELTKQMAAVQERQNRHTDDIKRIETAQTEDRNKLVTYLDKQDTKLANIELERKQVTQRLFEKIEESIRQKSIESVHMHEDVERDINSIGKNIEGLSKQITELGSDYHAKSNFTRGAVFVLALALGAGQWVLQSYINDYKLKQDDITAQFKILTVQNSENLQQIQLLQGAIVELKRNKTR